MDGAVIILGKMPWSGKCAVSHFTQEKQQSRRDCLSQKGPRGYQACLSQKGFIPSWSQCWQSVRLSGMKETHPASRLLQKTLHIPQLKYVLLVLIWKHSYEVSQTLRNPPLWISSSWWPFFVLCHQFPAPLGVGIRVPYLGNPFPLKPNATTSIYYTITASLLGWAQMLIWATQTFTILSPVYHITIPIHVQSRQTIPRDPGLSTCKHMVNKGHE